MGSPMAPVEYEIDEWEDQDGQLRELLYRTDLLRG